MTKDWYRPRPYTRTEPGTYRWFKEKFGCDVFERYRTYAAWDVVGGDPEQIERYRGPGWVFRYFKTHQERLADFATRLERFKKRSFLLRSNTAASAPGYAFGAWLAHDAAMSSKRCQRAARTRLAARFRQAWQAFFM